MSDLSQPPQAALALPATDPPVGIAWPAPDIAGYSTAHAPWPCVVEGLNGHAIQGELVRFEPVQGSIQLRLPMQRKPRELRLSQFRRLHLVVPLRALDAPPDARDLDSGQLGMPFEIEFDGALPWAGRTVGHREEACGLFLYEPVDAAASVRCWFVPRGAYRSATVGLRIGEALVEMHSATPEQIRLALAEQAALRSRRLGDLLVLRQVISADELAAALEQQARMPKARIGEALTALGFITPAQLTDALQQQRADRGVPLGELMVRTGMVQQADLQTALARKMGYPLVDVQRFTPDAEALARVPHALATRLPALPLMLRAGRLVVAVEDPTHRSPIRELERSARCKVVPVLARSGALRSAIARAYGRACERVDAADPLSDADDRGNVSIAFERGDSTYVGLHGDNPLLPLLRSVIDEARRQRLCDMRIKCVPGTEPRVALRLRPGAD